MRWARLRAFCISARSHWLLSGWCVLPGPVANDETMRADWRLRRLLCPACLTDRRRLGWRKVFVQHLAAEKLAGQGVVSVARGGDAQGHANGEKRSHNRRSPP